MLSKPTSEQLSNSNIITDLMSIGEPPRPERNNDRLNVAIEIILDSSAGRRASRISDLSFGGCYVESISNFRVGEIVTFELKDRDGTTISFKGEIAYVLEGFGFGLKFLGLGEEQNAFLRRALTADS
ncbi:MAG TPA: PilZ domain-containing protein [Pyrinomonadaceae bacterium]|nr:PilZ domain-containing protein [Pyrinomonadaceae bacterium]HMP64662.1 PilZ domain-containing protein [Pyrinomonadaceae bacterium]